MNESVGLDFARAIKAFMRSDPDVIILGEIRDTVTASKAIQAAETGHLVIATIHAESVPMALQRLRGLEVKTEDFEMLLRGVLVHFLVRSLFVECGARDARIVTARVMQDEPSFLRSRACSILKIGKASG